MISLRTATRDDIPVLADVLANVEARSDPSIDIRERRKVIAGWMNEGFGADEPESILSIIEFNGAPAGRFRVVRFPDRIFLGGIQIHPAFQGNGIGTHLITALIQESRSTGKPLHLDVDRNNMRARRLYERLGFEQHAESEKDFHMTFHPDRVARRDQARGDLNR